MTIDPSKLHFRSAKASDAPLAAPLIYSAAPEVFDFVFGGDRPALLEFLRRAFANGSGAFGHQRYTVAIVDGELVAIGSFYGEEDCPRRDLRGLWTLLRCFDPARFLRIVRRVGKMRGEMSHADTGTEFMVHFAVQESLRGRGIGSAFLRRQLDVARAKGRRRYALNVAESNHGARQLYERLGFRVVGETRWMDATPGNPPPRLKRMELEL
ncbi:MAG TPA: GNAT family N-acetyltransferase [Nannocystaceae bacterium]|nr:GNAT family N-acetyltransferase [Nannocystaceae bacterium]